MNPAPTPDTETIRQESASQVRLKYQRQLAVAAGMLSATANEMTATTVVGVLGRDDVEAFRSLVEDLSDEFGVQAKIKLQGGSFSVRFSRRAFDAAAWR